MITKEIHYEEGVCMKFPVKLKKSPINVVSLALRFKKNYPPEAVFGVIYSHIQEQFSAKPKPHPIMQLPEKIRLNDPVLRYTPYYKYEKKYIFNPEPITNPEPLVKTSIQKKSKTQIPKTKDIRILLR